VCEAVDIPQLVYAEHDWEIERALINMWKLQEILCPD
jgi:hypothetical protein